MQIHISTDIPGLKDSIVRGLSLFEGQLEEIYIFHLEEGRQRMKLEGLNKVLELAPQTNAPIIMISITPENYLADDMRYQAAMGYPHVSHYVMPQAKSIIQFVKEMLDEKRPHDSVAVKLANFSWKDDPTSTLRHDLNYVLQGYSNHSQESWERLARQVFGNHTFEELAAKTKAATGQERIRYFEGETLPGAYFDIEGTLFQDGKLNPQMVEIVKEKAKTVPVTIWTGGDPKEYRQQIRQAGIYAKILPKQIFYGATVKEAYDDLSAEKLMEEYGIKVENFHQV